MVKQILTHRDTLQEWLVDANKLTYFQVIPIFYKHVEMKQYFHMIHA